MFQPLRDSLWLNFHSPTASATDDTNPRWSPDGKHITFISNRAGIGWDIYTVDSDGQNVTPITDTRTIKGDPTWSPDSSQIVFWEQQKGGNILLFKIDLATKRIQRLTNDGPHDGAPVWRADGSAIYFDSDRDGAWGVYQMGPNGETPTRVTLPNVNSGRASISPDNQHLIFVSDRDESDELYVMNLDGNTIESGLKRLTKDLDSDYAPSWQPALPPNAPTVIIAPVVAATPTQAVAAVSVGQAVANGVDISPIPLDTYLVNSGIRAWQDQNWKGSGRRVAVIDTAFGGLTDFESKNNIKIILPPDGSDGEYNNSDNHHGTEALEIIHAIAPEAQLYACRYEGTIEGLSKCSNWLIDKEQVHIINHSVGIPILPLNGTSKWAKLVDDAFSRNVIWINSSGNFQHSFLKTLFYDPDGNNMHEFVVNQQRDELLRVETVPYSGNIILAWLQPTGYGLPFDKNGNPTKVDFDLEIVSLADPTKILYSSIISQRTEPVDPDPQVFDEAGNQTYSDSTTNADSPSSEFVHVTAQEPFGIRIKNVGEHFSVDIQLALVAEYVKITDENVTKTVISPGDARYSITVGAVRGASSDLAVYSSYGADNRDYEKPDLVAPGEFILPDGQTFVGTSAAAPVMAGIATLYWQAQQQGGNRLADVIYPELIKLVSPPPSPIGYGKGIVHLPPPTISNITSDAGSPPTPKTVWPKSSAGATQPTRCVSAIPSRMAIGTRAYANFNLGLFVRAEPNTKASQLAKLLLGDSFTIVDGPVCNSALSWWKIQSDDGGFGWVGEGSDYYLIAPINLKRAELPITYNPDCPLAAPTQLKIGQRAVIGPAARGGVYFFRAEKAKYQIAGLEPGPEVQILGGPVCEGKQNLLRWYVRIIDGSWADSEGWVAESGTKERILIPK